MTSIKTKLGCILLLPLLGFSLLTAQAANEAKSKAGRPPLKFSGTEYLHRSSSADQHEFTPKGQEDLGRWADMITINYYPTVKDGAGLAGTANAVLGNYKSHRAMVLKTNSLPRSEEKSAEHLIVVLFPRPEFIEAVFARFKIVNGVGAAAICSHREYGKEIGNQMSAWLQKNGPAIEKALMNWDEIPPIDAVK